MLSPEDRDAIEGLFDRIQTAAAKSSPRDREAEMLIQRRLRDAPASPYYMAQAILMQDQALWSAQQRIAELEAEIAKKSDDGSFLNNRFDAAEPYRRPGQQRPRGPWDRDDGDDGYGERQSGGGGFLAGAAQVALGVTTGLMFGSAIGGMFSGGANAGEYDGDQQSNDDDDSDGFDFGGDF